jgi:hypothetical protein
MARLPAATICPQRRAMALPSARSDEDAAQQRLPGRRPWKRALSTCLLDEATGSLRRESVSVELSGDLE